MSPRSRDTDPEAEAVQLLLLREASSARRASLALAVIGSLSEEQAQKMKRSIRRLRETWRA